MLTNINSEDADIRENARRRVASLLREICDSITFGADGLAVASFAGHFLQIECTMAKHDRQQHYRSSVHINNPFYNVTYNICDGSLIALPLDTKIGQMVSHTLRHHDVQRFLDRLKKHIERYVTDQASGGGGFPPDVVDSVETAR
jgi:hypothetical protein